MIIMAFSESHIDQQTPLTPWCEIWMGFLTTLPLQQTVCYHAVALDGQGLTACDPCSELGFNAVTKEVCYIVYCVMAKQMFPTATEKLLKPYTEACMKPFGYLLWI